MMYVDQPAIIPNASHIVYTLVVVNYQKFQ